MDQSLSNQQYERFSRRYPVSEPISKEDLFRTSAAPIPITGHSILLDSLLRNILWRCAKDSERTPYFVPSRRALTPRGRDGPAHNLHCSRGMLTLAALLGLVFREDDSDVAVQPVEVRPVVIVFAFALRLIDARKWRVAVGVLKPAFKPRDGRVFIAEVT